MPKENCSDTTARLSEKDYKEFLKESFSHKIEPIRQEFRHIHARLIEFISFLERLTKTMAVTGNPGEFNSQIKQAKRDLAKLEEDWNLVWHPNGCDLSLSRFLASPKLDSFVNLQEKIRSHLTNIDGFDRDRKIAYGLLRCAESALANKPIPADRERLKRLWHEIYLRGPHNEEAEDDEDEEKDR
jgi:hypothetical protein